MSEQDEMFHQYQLLDGKSSKEEYLKMADWLESTAVLARSGGEGSEQARKEFNKYLRDNFNETNRIIESIHNQVHGND